MLNADKKAVLLYGSLQLPLKVGLRAIIFQNGGHIRTSAVAAITQVDERFIVFETQDSTYCVAPCLSPEPTAMALSTVCA